MPDDLRKRSQLDRDSTARPGHTSRSGTSGVSDLRNADPIYKTYADHSLRERQSDYRFRYRHFSS